ncbi:4-(cytidine 5'-diphospho)-2-C-methyl-D-erythritol kinase [Nisaea nitritireducens]|uniref:4-(cytidine 5'-diphospho)-2-C-methyl-D-erythritol kinase n=1 Tax=Nisaea nitritireducens TaxID=568392 RepID=UPI001865C33E|nr:4-(cytidine 5'-diphospho)-2-C-methyl-D-erythritol kinase [Nisaea nitritireducens]
MAETGYSATLIAPAKINLSLTVLGRRDDGFHDLISLVAFADLHDRLSVTLSETGSDQLTVAGPFAGSLDRDNLVLKAISAFRKEIGPVPPLSITLHKAIPVAAGLGGGSADAAAILRLLAREHGLTTMAPSIQAIAAGLGADIPVCLDSRCRYMRGTGTTLDPEESGFARYPALLVNPGVAVPTGAVFGALAAEQKAGRDISGPRSLAEDIVTGRNDLEAPAVAVAPEIGPVLSALSDLPGALGARLSGSGATCFALFETDSERDRAAERFRQTYPAYWLHAGALRNWEMDSLFPQTPAFSG